MVRLRGRARNGVLSGGPSRSNGHRSDKKKWQVIWYYWVQGKDIKLEGWTEARLGRS